MKPVRLGSDASPNQLFEQENPKSLYHSGNIAMRQNPAGGNSVRLVGIWLSTGQAMRLAASGWAGEILSEAGHAGQRPGGAP